jgi:hypothetical protein
VTPLPLEQLAAHPTGGIRRAAAYSWGRQAILDPDVAKHLARDTHVPVRAQIAHALRAVDDDRRYAKLLNDLREDVSYAVRQAATSAVVHRRDSVRSSAR